MGNRARGRLGEKTVRFLASLFRKPVLKAGRHEQHIHNTWTIRFELLCSRTPLQGLMPRILDNVVKMQSCCGLGRRQICRSHGALIVRIFWTLVTKTSSLLLWVSHVLANWTLGVAWGWSGGVEGGREKSDVRMRRERSGARGVPEREHGENRYRCSHVETSTMSRRQ